MKVGSGSAVYRNIALDIANKIVRGEFKPNTKISGRSTLAGMYNVSPETIRRAVALLEGMEVVSASAGSGIEVLSVSAAEKFIQAHKSNEYLSTVKEDIMDLLDRRRELDNKIEENLNKILDFMERFRNISPFVLVEVGIKEGCRIMNKKLSELKFWQHTGATIVAFRRGREIVVSPGPDYSFELGDIIIVIGNSGVYERVWNFLYYEQYEDNNL